MTVAPSGGAPPRLFLVDGYALVYRAFFAMITRPLRTAKGENTSAAWGVANFLARLLDTHRPEYVASCLACGAPLEEIHPTACPHCGFAITPGETTCPNCNRRLG